EDPRACPRFAAALLADVHGGPAPGWMQERLRAAGMRPIDVMVDVTNYVMLELGQPLHAYDIEHVRGRTLVARPARPGERLRTLDGVERQLDPSTLVIADAERALGLAGILGGEESEIRPGTRGIALECASFEPLGIRRTTARYGLQGSSGSAAARRFGLDLSPALVQVALARAVELLREHAGARLVAAIDRYPRPRAVPTVRLGFDDFERKLGVAIPRDEVLDALRRLRFEAHAEDGALVATPPAIRTDVAIREDVVEEVARMVGYERIPTRIPSGPLPPFQPHPFEALRERVRDLLAGFGLQEVVSYSLIDPAWLDRLTPDRARIAPCPLRVTNPTTVAQSVLRPTLRASLLDTASRNLRHRSGVALFEISPAYLPRGRDLPEERWIAGVILSGEVEPVVPGETWLVPARRYDLHDLRGVLDGVARGLRLRQAGEQRHGAAGLHPSRSATVGDPARPLLVYGQLDPRVAEDWELPAETLLAEIDVAALLDLVASPAASAPPRYPPALRDISLTVDEDVAYGDVEREIRGAAKALLEAVALVDLYRGPQAGTGRKSLTLRLTLRSPAGTLSDAEIERAMRRIEGRLAQSLGAAVRA
ncbi:MAG: phenylalanine--tRNA ligase subunit beta, partial [Candidatus Limnocylindria bacterium]